MSGSTPPKQARLVLADGTVYRGYAFGAVACQHGEVVFNTSMTGYQEIVSDPSYAGQIVA
ncbi:MAG: carbamoyl-phosphate synthase small subunit, partial [Myxococcota bacterium]